tara:strand:- start:1244 stop:1615 length:372 start_codon:yes stop_codon:yes gene_type:complete
MKFDELNKDNFVFFAIRNYDNPTSSTSDDFDEDMNRFKYVKRWLKKYHETGNMNTHLLLNHIIIIFNCWHDAAVPMLYYKIDPKYWCSLTSFLVYLQRLPEYPETDVHGIIPDLEIVRQLQGL